jgi:RNA polymerase sigma-70 factor (ECF subfamily)
MDGDRALLEAWQGGSREAGGALIKRHYAAIYRFFHGKAPPYACEDLAQRTFEVLCRRPDAYRSEGSFRAYLYGVARYVWLGWARRDHEHRQLVSQTCPGPSPSGALAAHEEQQIVATALRQLDFDDQALIELKDWEGLTQAELAALFEVPRPTVARRLQRARARLRRRVEALLAEPRDRDIVLRNLESCMQSIRACLDRGEHLEGAKGGA